MGPLIIKPSLDSCCHFCFPAQFFIGNRAQTPIPGWLVGQWPPGGALPARVSLCIPNGIHFYILLPEPVWTARIFNGNLTWGYRKATDTHGPTSLVYKDGTSLSCCRINHKWVQWQGLLLWPSTLQAFFTSTQILLSPTLVKPNCALLAYTCMYTHTQVWGICTVCVYIHTDVTTYMFVCVCVPVYMRCVLLTPFLGAELF